MAKIMETHYQIASEDRQTRSALLLNDGDGFTEPLAMAALKLAIWGAREIPRELSDRLEAEALARAPQHPVESWKSVLKGLRAAAPAKEKPRSPRPFWRRFTQKAALKSSGVSREFIDQLLADIKTHQGITRANREAYRGDGGDEDMRRIFWPSPAHARHPRSIFDEAPLARRIPLVTKSTAISSAGSCFAMEIAHWLQDNGFNYIITDPKPTGYRLPISSARWGTLFNAPSFRQLVEHAFGIRSLPKLLWRIERKNGPMIADPFREDIFFESLEEWEEDYEPHRAHARKALETAEVFIMTLGMAEVWFTRNSRFYCSRCHWGLASELVDHKVLTVDETVGELELMLGILRRYNPGVKIIISASPVPLHATFRGAECGVISANAYSKAVQRVSAEMFAARNKDVYYFPSYESVMHCTKNAWDEDQRHVSREAVAKVMQLFCDMFVAREP